MLRWMEVTIEEDRYGNIINTIERVDIYADVVAKDNYKPFLTKDVHYISNSSTYFHEETHYHYNTFYYKTIELVYSEKRDLIRATTKNVYGQVTKEVLCDYRYDEFGNKVYKRIKTSIDNIDQKEEINVYTYKNKYGEMGQLIETVKFREDEEIIWTRKYSYKSNRLDQIENYDSGNILYEVSKFIYEGVNYEERVYSYEELSHYNEYTVLENHGYRKTMLNPSKSKYRWSLNGKYIHKGIAVVDVYEPILMENIIIEIMEYIIAVYGDKIQLIRIQKHDEVNMDLFREDMERMFENYYDRYKIEIG